MIAEPRQRHVAYLGSVTESTIKILGRRCYFWDDISERLDRLDNQITTADREQIEAAIAKKVPRPSATEYKDAARERAKFFGWNYLTDKQKAVLEDEADQLYQQQGLRYCGNQRYPKRRSAVLILRQDRGPGPHLGQRHKRFHLR